MYHWAKDKGGLPVRFKVIRNNDGSYSIKRFHKGDSAAMEVSSHEIYYFSPSELREIARLMPKE
jgi:hypothetical protein